MYSRREFVLLIATILSVGVMTNGVILAAAGIFADSDEVHVDQSCGGSGRIEDGCGLFTTPYFQRIDAHFDQIDGRFDQIDARLDRIESRLDSFERSMEATLSQLVRTNARLEGLLLGLRGAESGMVSKRTCLISEPKPPSDREIGSPKSRTL